jgi:hypothetical protein
LEIDVKGGERCTSKLITLRERETLRERDAFYKRRVCYMFLRGEKHDLFICVLFALVFSPHLLPISNVRFRGRGSLFRGS